MAKNDVDVFTRAASASRTRHDRTVAQGRSHARKDSVAVTVSMSPQDRDAMREYAHEMGMPLSVLVRVACKEYIQRHSS